MRSDENMDNKKIGEFICNLRKEKKLSQYELADLIHISRESISKWERGIGKPDKNCILELSKIFEVSTDEILLGKKIENKDETELLVLDLYDNLNKNQKRLLITYAIMFIASLLFFLYYFINNYNTIHVYNINYTDDEVTINNGILVSTKEKIYFNLGEINTNNEIKYVKLYYKDKKDKDNLIYKTDGDSIILYDYYGYNEYFDYNKIDYVLKSLYLDLEFEDTIHTIKLNAIKDFSNNKINYKKNNKIIDESENDNKMDISKIKEKFKEKDGSYVYNKNNIEITYFDDSKIININIKKDNEIKEEWIYFINQDMLSYTEYDKDDIKNSFSFSDNNYTCLIDRCSNEKEKTEYYFDLMQKILT